MLFLTLLGCGFPEPADSPADPIERSPAGTLSGWVLDDQGSAIAMAHVTTWPGGRDAVTGAEGEFALDRLQPGTYSLLVAADGYDDATVEDLLVEADGEQQVEVVLTPSVLLSTLEVWVKGPTNEPVVGALVQAGDQEGLTDAVGTTRFSDLPGEPILVAVSDPSERLHAASRTVTVPQTGEVMAFTLSGNPSADAAYVHPDLCVLCHTGHADDWTGSAHANSVSDVNTVPWAISPTADGLWGGPHRGAVPFDAQGPLSMAWIPPHPERSAWFGSPQGEVDWTPPPAESPEGDCASCHESGVEQAVGCQACHGPGSEHAWGSDALKPFTIINPSLLEAEDENALCATCHGAANLELWPSGAAAVPNAQSDEFAASLHGEGRCSDCHDPHTGGTRHAVNDNTLCLSCHEGLDFPDEAAITAHSGHPQYAPEAPYATNRCVGCHMPGTTARLAWSHDAGEGDLSSHLFVALPPSETVAAFDAQGATNLDPWEYPAHACVSCHSWSTWLFQGNFVGPNGDPSLRSTHVAYQEAYEEIWP